MVTQGRRVEYDSERSRKLYHGRCILAPSIVGLQEGGRLGYSLQDNDRT